MKLNYIHGIAESERNKSILMMLQGNYIEAEKLARESLNWYSKTTNKTNIPATFLVLGYARMAQSAFNEGMDYFEKAYEYGKKTDDRIIMFLALRQLGSSCMESGNYDKAFDRYRESLQLILEIENDYWIITQFELIGELYRKIEDYNTALEYYRKAYQRKKDQPDFDYCRFAELFSLKQEFDSAKYYYSLVDTAKYPRAVLYVSLSEYYFLQKQYDKALVNAINSLPHLRKSNDRNTLMRALLDVAKINFAKQNIDSSFHYAKEGLTIAKETGARQFILEGYRILYSVYDRRQKTDSAYFYYRHYISLKDSILTDQIKGKLVAYSYEQRIELLDKEKKIQKGKLQRESLLKNFLIVGILILLLLSAFIFRNSILKRKNEKNKREIAENQLRIQKLEAERTKAELQRQATELEMQALRAQMNPHFIFNSLNSINRFILQNDKVQASEYLTKFSRLTRMILNSSTNPTVTLAEDLEALQLYLELERLRFGEKFTFKIECDPDIDAAFIQVPPMLLQPFVENAIWHGLMNKEGEGRLWININQEDSTLICTITDDGIGRKRAGELEERSGKHKSMGMKITESRIAMMQKMEGKNKSVEIRDLVDVDGSAAGTEVVLRIPVLQQA